jgi:rhodanese-related sulfurtransferase
MKKFFFLVIAIFSAKLSISQNPVNWTKDQLLQPSVLAQTIKSNEAVPAIFSIGPGAVIKNSIDIGSIKEKENFEAFKKQLAELPKDTSIVVYCGCCPFEHCPNVRPAVATLKQMNFTNYKLLNLPTNIKTDWLDKGYPSRQ